MTDVPVSFLLNWHATSYHAPIFLAQAKGYFKEEGVSVAILEPNDPSDCAGLVGRGTMDMGVKAMVHTIAAKANGHGVTSVGCILDEPFTGLLYLEGGVDGKGNGITNDFRSLKGKRIGYVGYFGAVQVRELAEKYGMDPEKDFELIRVGMDVVGAILDGRIDAGVGIGAVNGIELEAWCTANGRPETDVKLIRIDELAELGCCCFCSILVLANDDFRAKNPEKVAAVMRAIKRGADDVFAEPKKAWGDVCKFKKTFRTELFAKIYERCFPFMSRDLRNVKRDWTKVSAYCHRIGVCDANFTPNYTNEFIQWEQLPEPADPAANQVLMAKKQDEVRVKGGVLTAAQPVAVAA
ncbi:Glycylpeptide N-tetradecanoyltransferase [Rhodotorula toruloides]|uniref:4-amino-5-hydroxymethyl-2-methylpyrimidine phosphate synthase n=2 Tax=Rhodotorula toruloides TaxID=5286 RepID=A0A0K3CR45_RHOTO